MSSETETKETVIDDKGGDENSLHKNAEGDESEADKDTREGDEEVPVTFPQRLMDVLSDESVSDIISWLPHGKGFMIKDKKRFADEILSKYFKKSKFTSFTRKLNRWNFVRVTRGPETGAYYHQFFVRENPKLVSQMTCINSKAPQQLQPMNPVALGLGTGGQYFADTSDPASMQRIQEQRQAFMQQQWQQQQAFMAWMAQQQQQQQENAGGSKEGGGDSAEGKGDEEEGNASEAKTSGDADQKPGEGGSPQGNTAAAMMAFQQQQYYAMFMAHQQQMAAMASGQMPNYNMNMGGSAPHGQQPGDAPAGASGETSGSGEAAEEASEPTKTQESIDEDANGNE